MAGNKSDEKSTQGVRLRHVVLHRLTKKTQEELGLGAHVTRKRTFVVDDQVDLTVLLQVLGRLEALRALGVVLGLVHLVNSVQDDSRSSEADACTADRDTNISLHGIARRDSSVGGVLADGDVGNAATFQSLKISHQNAS